MLGISTRNDPRAALNNPNLKRYYSIKIIDLSYHFMSVNLI